MIAKLAWAGIAAPIWFTVLVVVQGLLQPDYSHVAMPISALAAWPYGWIQVVDFLGFGVLMIGYAIGLHRGIASRPGGWIPFVFLLISAAGLLLAGLFSWRHEPGGFVVPPAHRAGAVMVFGGGGLGLVGMSRRMASDPRWRDLARFALACGVAILVLFAAGGALSVPAAAPLHSSAGLLQRLVLAVWFPCTIVLAVRLRLAAMEAG